MTSNEIRKFILKSAREMLASLVTDCARDKQRRLILAKWHRRRVDAAHRGEVLYEPAVWLGRTLTGAERVSFCRELARMQADGLLVRVNASAAADERTTHIRIIEQTPQIAP